MSDQGKSNFQAFGAGLLGFVAVMAIGGGALMVHNSQQAKSAAMPAAAAAPIDIGAAPRAMMGASSVQKEGRAESPAPLLGADEEPVEAAAAPAGAPAAAPATAAASATQAAAKAKSAAPSLEPIQHQDMSGHGSTAEAIVKNTLAPKKEHKGLAKKSSNVEATAVAPTSLASVHYGVTSRNELMGRAAGPVYNIKGGAKGAAAVNSKMAGDTSASIADLKAQLEKAGLPAEQRALILKQLESANQTVSDADKAGQ